jgi:5-hydroxyisourate hydrolase
MSVSTHVLDAVLGRPAPGIAVVLYAGDELVAEGSTDADGRCRLTEEPTVAGPHRLVFGTGEWFAGQRRETFWPEVVLAFAVREPAEHHHVPLLLSPFAYSTYRGT